MNIPVVFVPRLRLPAWHGDMPCDLPKGQVMDLKDALAYDGWGADTLIQCVVDSRFPDAHPRLGSGAFAAYVTGAAEAFMHAVLFDVDHEGHTPPPDGWAEAISASLAIPHGWYRTPNGMRLVFQPAEPVPAAKARAYMHWLADRLDVADLDRTSLEPTRLQRTMYALDRPCQAHDLSGLAPLPLHPDMAGLPDDDKIAGITVRQGAVPAVAPVKKTEMSVLPKALKDKLADGQLRAPAGERHATLLTAALDVARHVTSEEDIYRFLLPSAQNLFAGEPERATAELWRIACWARPCNEARESEQKAERDAVKAEAAVALGTTTAAVMRQLVLAADGCYWIYDEATHAHVGPIKDKDQVHMLLSAHCPVLAGDRKPGASFASLIHRYGSRVQHVQYTYECELEGLQPDGTYVVRKALPTAAPAVYRECVQEWLEALGGDRLLDWLSCYTLVDQPVCALYLCGPASIGKNLLGEGLARMFVSNEALDYGALDDFPEQLLANPLVWADETMGDTDSGAFRQLVGNGRHRVRPMRHPATTLRGYPRLLVTANNADLLRLHDNPSLADLDAVRLRVGFLQADGSAGAVLRRQAREAGCESAREWTTRWLDEGWLVQHLYWLADNRVVKPGERFLVEGWDSPLTRRLSVASGDAEQVMYAVLNAIELNDPGSCGVFHDNGEVLVNASLLGRNWKSAMPSIGDRPPTSNSLGRSLRQLSHEASRRTRMGNDVNARTYWIIPVERVLEYVEILGIGSPESVQAWTTRGEQAPAIYH